jgi:hypothetical protein
MYIDSRDSNAPYNQKESEQEEEFDELEITKEMVKLQTERLNYKIWQLSKLAEIEECLVVFGNLTYEQLKEKAEILNQYKN